MSEGILKFKLPEENDDFKLASSANDLYSVICDMDRKLRKYLKYDHNLTMKTKKILAELREELNTSFHEITGMDL